MRLPNEITRKHNIVTSENGGNHLMLVFAGYDETTNSVEVTKNTPQRADLQIPVTVHGNRKLQQSAIG